MAEDIDGCKVAFFCSYDGILIDQFKIINDVDADLLGATWSDICRKINGFEDLFVTLENETVAVKPLEDGFVCVVLSKDGNIGRAKFELNKCRSDFGQ